MSHSSLASEVTTVNTMGRDELALLVRHNIAKRLRLSVDDVALDASLADLNLDSLDVAELMFVLEDQLRKYIELDQTTRLVSVEDVIEWIWGQIGR